MSETSLTVRAGDGLAGVVAARAGKMPERLHPSALGEVVAPLRPVVPHHDRMGSRGSALTLRAILGRKPRILRARFEGPAKGAGAEVRAAAA